MKKLSSNITAVLFASCISLNTFASTITVNWDGTGDTSGFGGPEDWALNVVIQPETPTIYNSIEIISTGVRGAGPVTVENTFFQIDEAALTLDIFLNVGFLTVVSPWHYTENIGSLPAGVYDLTVTAYDDYGPETSFTSFEVVVPEPTITVNWDGTGDFLAIQDAINASIDGDVIIVMPGVYNENVDYLGKNITLRSSDPTNPLIIEATQITPPDEYINGSDGTFEGFRLNGRFEFGSFSGIKSYSPTIRNCHIVFHGPGIKCRVGVYQPVNYPLIENNIIEAGIGVYVFAQSETNPIIRNNTFDGKDPALLNGGIKYRGHNEIGEIYNNIFVNLWCGVLFTYDSIFEQRIQRIQYNNFYGNTYNYYSHGVEFDLTGVNGNISSDPLFVDYANGNYHLQKESPCIDTGDPDSEFQPGATDLDGNPRIINGTVDMGAYEFIHPVKVSVDIKPQSCPNPVNVKSKGVLPVAILGSDVLDVNDIDLDTILLEGVAPLRGSYEDVASPVIDETECACTSEGADGYMDLTMKFNTQDILSALGEVADDDICMLNLTGHLKDGTPIEGADCILIMKKGKGNIGGLHKIDLVSFGELALHWGECGSGGCEDWDIDGDGSVGFGDLVYMVGEHSNDKIIK